MKKVIIEQYKWEGKWGPFKIKTRCGECDMTTGILRALLKEFKGKPVTLEVKKWLNNWYKIIWKGAWHAPIVLVNGKMIMQGKTVDKGAVRQEIIKQLK